MRRKAFTRASCLPLMRTRKRKRRRRRSPRRRTVKRIPNTHTLTVIAVM